MNQKLKLNKTNIGKSLQVEYIKRKKVEVVWNTKDEGYDVFIPLRFSEKYVVEIGTIKALINNMTRVFGNTASNTFKGLIEHKNNVCLYMFYEG